LIKIGSIGFLKDIYSKRKFIKGGYEFNNHFNISMVISYSSMVKSIDILNILL